MQRIVIITGGVKSYLGDPEQGVCEDTQRCPFCAMPHRLWLHGWYHRGVLFDDQPQMINIPIRRLFCPAKRQTVSLLPDFCIPRHQMGPAVLGVFLCALVVKGFKLCAALVESRGDLSSGAAHHSAAQSLRDGFLHRLPLLRAYLAGFKARFKEADQKIAIRYRKMAIVLALLQEDFEHVQKAFIHHGRVFHERHQLGLI